MAADESRLRELIKESVAHTIMEHREFFREIVEEVIEDIALSRAVDQGMTSANVSREEIIRALEQE